MPQPFSSLELMIRDGGRLLSNLSKDSAGVSNWVAKRDFRRVLENGIGEARREGHDYFWGNPSLPIGNQPFPHLACGKAAEPITLIHEARRPNGQKALIVGTPSNLYRYFALENGAYVEAGYMEDPPAANAPYFDDNPGEWILLKDGFAAVAQRWEAVSINGWSVFNNGVDLPCSYRVEDRDTVPLYELRESGVAAVGCIAEFFGILHAADISEIQEEALLELFDPIGVRRSGAMLGQIAIADTLTTPENFFSASDVGRVVIFEDGVRAPIIFFNNARDVNLSGGNPHFPQRFMLRTPASQVGSFFSRPITATQANGSPNVLSSAPVFNGGMVGKRFRYINGWSALITVFTDNQHITLATAAPEAFVGLPFYIVSEPEAASADYIVVADADVFTAGMVGLEVSWEDGTVRKIVGFIDATHVYVDSDLPIAKAVIGIENEATYAAYTEKQFINRISYRIAWGMNELPRRFSPVFRGKMNVGEWSLYLDQPAKSIEIGDQLVVEGAGIAGSNLTANVVYVAANRVIALDAKAQTTVTGAAVSKADALQSIVGWEDLADDSSGIVAMRELGGRLVIFKDSAIALARYTGDIANPFEFTLRRIKPSQALFYRNTLVMVGAAFHLYAGRSSFFRFDLVNQYPVEEPSLEVCKNEFFASALLANTSRIWAADNVLTKEIVIGLPEIPLLCADYFSNPMTVSTSTAPLSAMATVKRPASSVTVGETEDWCLCGTAQGAVLIYGKTLQPNPSWAGAKQIIYRRHAVPYSAIKEPYDSVLKSGLSPFGSQFSAKDLAGWLPLLGSGAADAAFTFNLWAVRNSNETEELLANVVVTPPQTLVPLFFRSVLFGDEIIVSGINNPFHLLGRIFDVAPVRSKSIEKRVTV